MLVALAVLVLLSAAASPNPHGETPAELEVARERPGLQNLELGILRQLLFELLAVKQLRPPDGNENISFQEIASKLWKGLLRMQDRLWQLAIDTNIMPESVQDTGELAGPHGMLAWEFFGLRQRVLDYLGSRAENERSAQAARIGEHWEAVRELATALTAKASVDGRADLRDLAALRALDDVGLRELIALMPALAAGSNHTLCSKVSSDLRWILKLLPPGDRFAVALGHYALFWIQWANYRPKHGAAHHPGTSSITQAWWLSQQAQFVGVRQICEVGFNAGHSAWAFLSSSRQAHMVSFDLVATSYTRACHRVIRGAFPGRHRLVEGPSNLTIPRFVMENLNHRCDLIYIDGGHDEEEAASDLLHMSMLARAGTVLVMDDVGCTDDFCDGPMRAWQSFVQAGRLEKLACHAELARKWCYGRYLQ